MTDPNGSRVRRVRVIWNPEAGSKGGISTNSTSEPELRALMARHNLGDELVAGGSEEEARASVRDAVRAGYEMVVGAGGDGTALMVARELVGSPVALGILPLGSVMNVARMLGYPRELEPAAAILAGGVVRTIDVGEANGQVFLETGSVGMNAAIFRESARLGDGEVMSAFRAIWTALRYQPARMRVQLDDRTLRTRALMITVANGPYTGLGLTVAPEACLDDGRFDVHVFSRFSRWELVRHLLAITLGRRRYFPQVDTYQATHVRIDGPHPHPARADSEDLGETPVEFAVRPRALRVVAPAEGVGAA